MFKEVDSMKKNFFPDEFALRKYENYTSERRRKNLKILFDNTSVLPFKWHGKYLCFYCSQNCADYSELKEHTRSHGPCTTRDYCLKLVKGAHNEIKIDITDVRCEICDEQFTSLDEIISHLISKHGLEYDESIEIAYQEYFLEDSRCQFCGEQFDYFPYLVTHINTIHPENCFTCDYCGNDFNKKRFLSYHIRHKHRQGFYPCSKCNEVFETLDLLQKHKKAFHFRKCKICNCKFATLVLLQKHLKLEHSLISVNKCPRCPKLFSTMKDLKLHLLTCQSKIIVKDDDLGSLPKKQNIAQIRQNIMCVLELSTAVPFKFFTKFSCYYCVQKFTEFQELKEHTASEHSACDLRPESIKRSSSGLFCVKVDVTSLSCKLCRKRMDSLDTLIDHLIIKHKVNYDKSFTKCFDPFKILKDNISCPHCSNKFRYFATLIRHINAEHSKNKRICSFCGKCFKNTAHLNIHINCTHTGSCECEVCGLQFRNVWCLARHKAKNHDVKDFKCPQCPEKFQSHYHKQRHLIQVHGVGHKCSYCGRMFTRNSFVKDHIRRMHLKERNIPCKVCNEHFFDNHALKQHMVKHDRERKFTCNDCGKSFLRRKSLTIHIDTHNKKKKT